MIGCRLENYRQSGVRGDTVFCGPAMERLLVRYDHGALAPAAYTLDLGVRRLAKYHHLPPLPAGTLHDAVDAGHLGTCCVYHDAALLLQCAAFLSGDAVGPNDDLCAGRHIVHPFRRTQSSGSQSFHNVTVVD